MKSANRLIVSMLVVAALAVAFWLLALGPKRQEANQLAGQVNQLQASLAESQTKATEAVAARRQFPIDYQQLVVLGKAVPPSDETSSLLVELNQIASPLEGQLQQHPARRRLPAKALASALRRTTSLHGALRRQPLAASTAATVPPTEAAASLLPLGATIGPAGLGVMPYDLSFQRQLLPHRRLHQGDRLAGPHRWTGCRGRRPPGDAQWVRAERPDPPGFP